MAFTGQDLAASSALSYLPEVLLQITSAGFFPNVETNFALPSLSIAKTVGSISVQPPQPIQAFLSMVILNFFTTNMKVAYRLLNRLSTLEKMQTGSHCSHYFEGLLQ